MVSITWQNVGIAVLSVSVTSFRKRKSILIKKKNYPLRRNPPMTRENNYPFESLFYTHALEHIFYVITDLMKFQSPTDEAPHSHSIDEEADVVRLGELGAKESMAQGLDLNPSLSDSKTQILDATLLLWLAKVLDFFSPQQYSTDTLSTIYSFSCTQSLSLRSPWSY